MQTLEWVEVERGIIGGNHGGIISLRRASQITKYGVAFRGGSENQPHAPGKMS